MGNIVHARTEQEITYKYVYTAFKRINDAATVEKKLVVSSGLGACIRKLGISPQTES